MKTARIARFAAFCALAATLAAAPACRRDTTLVADHVAALKAYDLAVLNEGQRQEFVKIINSEICPCGVPMHLGACIERGRGCDDAHRMVRFAMRRLQAGDGTSRVIHMLDRMFQQGDKAHDIPGDDAPAKGDASAPVTLTVFSDFECPFCKKAEPVLTRVLKEYAGRVRVVFRHYPLAKLHKNANNAALASVAAHKQGKFWEMHELLFKNNLNLEKENLTEYAKRVGLDVERFKKDIEDKATAARLKADMDLGAKVGITGTPAFFINGKQMTGGGRFENYRDYIEVAIDDAKHKSGATKSAASK